jgi:hypothetical protein
LWVAIVDVEDFVSLTKVTIEDGGLVKSIRGGEESGGKKRRMLGKLGVIAEACMGLDEGERSVSVHCNIKAAVIKACKEIDSKDTNRLGAGSRMSN